MAMRFQRKAAGRCKGVRELQERGVPFFVKMRKILERGGCFLLWRDSQLQERGGGAFQSGLGDICKRKVLFRGERESFCLGFF